MRRQAVVIVVIVALVVAIALLRPPRLGPDPTPPHAINLTRDGQVPKSSEGGSDALADESHPLPLPPAPPANTTHPRLTLTPRPPMPPPKCKVTVVDAEDKPVASAVIFVVRVPMRGEVKLQELMTGGDGTIEVLKSMPSSSISFPTRSASGPERRGR